MRDSKIFKSGRIAAGIMGLLLLITVLFSAFFIAAEADHDCRGDDCPVCACVRQCENTIHQIGSGTAASVSVILPIFFFLILSVRFTADFLRGTPVSRKIRMNN